MPARGWLRAVVLAAAVAGAMPAAAAAQRLAPGVRMKARTPEGWVRATVLQVTDTALVLERQGTRDTFSVAYGRMADVRVATWKEASRSTSLLLGIAGAAVGLVVAARMDGDDPMKGAAAGSLAGIGLGQLIRTDHWVAVPVAAERLAVRAEANPPAGAAVRAAPRVGGDPAERGRAEPAPAAAAAPAVVPAPGVVPAEVGELALDPVQARALAYGNTARAVYLTGMRIRYGTAGAPLVTRVARVVGVAGDTLVVLRDVAGAAPERVRADTLVDFEVSGGWERRTEQGVMIGGVVGALAVAVPMAWALTADPDPIGVYFAGVLTTMGGGVGCALGALIGHANNRERWVHVATPVASAGPRVRLRLALAIRR